MLHVSIVHLVLRCIVLTCFNYLCTKKLYFDTFPILLYTLWPEAHIVCKLYCLQIALFILLQAFRL